MSDSSICYTIQINIFINIKIKRIFYVQYVQYVILTCIIIERRKIHVHSIYKSRKYIGLLVRF